MHIMLHPSGSCTTRCGYCFGPNTGPIMDDATFSAALDWMESLVQPMQSLEVTLHGGEPLLAGITWHRHALARMRARFGPRLRLAVQSNLWLLDDAFCDLFTEFDVTVGTSLDGPESINNAQRGTGYYAKTMRGIEAARRHDIDIGIICTFTPLSAARWRDVFDFFLRERLSFSVHGAIPTMGLCAPQPFALTADAYAKLVVEMFDYYLQHIRHIRVSTFDQFARGLTGSCAVCTFGPCLGHYLSISSDGSIYPCNRFVPHRAWQLGTVSDRPSVQDLSHSLSWQRLQDREKQIEQDCGDCAYITRCNGGCAYHALAVGTGLRDGYCQAYQRIFAYVMDKALAQIFSQENLAAVVNEGVSDRRGLLRNGELLQVMRGGPHPSSITAAAQEFDLGTGPPQGDHETRTRSVATVRMAPAAKSPAWRAKASPMSAIRALAGTSGSRTMPQCASPARKTSAPKSESMVIKTRSSRLAHSNRA